MMSNFITKHSEFKCSYRILPTELEENPKYARLDPYALILYSYLLSRIGLSKKNHWYDKDSGMVYIIFTREEAAKKLHCGLNKATKAFQALSDAGLIMERRQHGKKANIIFVSLPEQAKRDRVKEQQADKARKSIKEKREQILKSINTNIKAKRQVCRQLKQKIVRLQEECVRARMDSRAYHVSPEEIGTVKEQIEYSYFEQYYTHEIPLVDSLTRCFAEMKNSPYTKAGGVTYDWAYMNGLADSVTASDVVMLLEYIREHVTFSGIRNKLSYLKSVIISFLHSQRADCCQWGDSA